jgi:ABC-type amino acid transport substrate-binding protein
VERFSGSVLSNGSWNGLIGMLARREADVAITGVIMTPMRTEVVDFTLPIFLSK